MHVLVVVVVVSTGRPTGITPYPTYGSPFGYILGQAVFGTNVPELFPQGVALHPKQPSYSALTPCPYYRARNGTTEWTSLPGLLRQEKPFGSCGYHLIVFLT